MGIVRIIKLVATADVPFPPQSWTYKEDIEKLNKIDPKHIISYHPDGSVYSRYEDKVWRLTYSLNERQWHPIDFTQIVCTKDREVIKRLMLSVIYFSRGKGNTVKTPKSIKSIYGRVLIPMYEFASKEKISLQALFGRRQMMKRYLTSSVKANKSRAMNNLPFLRFIRKLDESISGVHYDFDMKHDELLVKYVKEYKTDMNQSECIPPRILQNAQQMRWEHINLVVEVQARFISLIERTMSESENYYDLQNGGKRRAEKAGHLYKTFSDLALEFNLGAFCEKYSIKCRMTLKNYLAWLSRTSRHLIYGYSGMRNDEGTMLEVGCYRDKGAGVYPVIIGLEKKNGVPIEHHFVTIKEISKVINLQEEITKVITKFTHPDIKFLPLFLNPSWLTGGTVKYLESIANKANHELPLDQTRLILTKDELELTLKATEPNRDWENDKDYQVGKPWKFNWHQYRRSIAVYGLGTGLVSLTALGKQYRQLFEATTAHYGNGHYVAQPLHGTDSKYHLKYEMDSQREYYEGLVMFRDMMFNLERPKSNFFPKQNNNESANIDDQIISPETSNTIAKKIKNHEISYTNTAIGSCKSLKPCDGHIMLFYTGCVDCDDAEVNDDKLAYTIQATNKFKNELKIHMPNSAELRDTEKDLMDLIRLQQKRQGDKHE